MKKLVKALLLLLFIILTPAHTQAVVYMNDDAKRGDTKKVITLTGFVDYAPLGQMHDLNYTYSPYDPTMVGTLRQNGVKVEARPEDTSSSTFWGVFVSWFPLGIYHETKIYNGIDYVFPSILNNPITVIMLPDRIDEVKTVEDLKKLKGAISQKEWLSDYVTSELEYFQVEKLPDYDAIFEKLFRGEIDYAFVSQYAGLIAVAKTGLRNKVSFAKQMVWNMPLFIGVSKMSPNRKYLLPRLVKFCEDAKNKQKLEEHLIKTVNQIEQKYIGAVPPDYVKE